MPIDEEISWNDVPRLLREIKAQNAALYTLISKNPNLNPTEEDPYWTIEELMENLPGKVARQTIYMKVNNRTIPYEKFGRRLFFRRSVIQKWLANGRRMDNLNL